MFDGIVVRYEINAVVESKPEIIILIQEKRKDIVELQTFLTGEILNHFPLFIDHIAAVQVGADSNPVARHRDRRQYALVL